MKKIILLLLLGNCTKITLAQQNSSTQYLYWIRFQNQLIFSPKLYWNNEVDNRRYIDPDVEAQFIYHSRLHYRYKKWDYAGGLTLSWAYAAHPEDGYVSPTFEIRPVAEVSHEQPVGKSLIQNRIRVDNRFFESDPEKSIWEESFYVMRFRYRLQWRIPLTYAEESIPRISLRFMQEIMVNNKENFFDQYRFYASTEYYLNKIFSLEFGYLYIYQQRFGRDEFFNRNCFRFSVLHRVTVHH
ncbi:MAG: DUF2490 domain-containing protein [Cyclobacteriaceae bacterium]|nr:DUF2490 domain-containing protein [Cyclobacteriaceae bacterium]